MFFLKNHPGSIRATVDETGAVVGYDDYDPWGKVLAGRSLATPWSSGQGTAMNKFTGKLFDDDYGLNWYYFGARYYDAAVGRFLTIDRFADKYPFLTPYQYAANNPALFVDVNGDTANYYDEDSGEYLGTLFGNDAINDRTISKADCETLLKKKYQKNNQTDKNGKYLNADEMETYLNNPDNVATKVINLNSDIGILARIGYAEFRGGNKIEQLAALDVVMNRVASVAYPNTVEAVVTQRHQFSSLGKNDSNKPFYFDPYGQVRLNSANFMAWTRAVSSALSIAKGGYRGITQGAILYYSPRSMVPANSKPTWNFNLLREVLIKGIRQHYMRLYKLK